MPVDCVRIARETYGAYESGDRTMVEKHLAEDFSFYSPADVGIDLSTSKPSAGRGLGLYASASRPATPVCRTCDPGPVRLLPAGSGPGGRWLRWGRAVGCASSVHRGLSRRALGVHNGCKSAATWAETQGSKPN
jgi:hypothetical protein